jgi:hypothetical protein
MGVFDLLGKAATKGAKKAAPFFSKADVVLDELPRTKGLGNEFLAEIVKKGAKPTELRERGIEKALKDKPKMTKAEVQKIFEEKAPPKVQEKVFGSDVPDYDEWLDAKALEMYGREYHMLNRREQSKLDKMYGALELTQYDRYKTPGGENYREILLKLPNQEKKITDADIEDWFKKSFDMDIADDAGPDWREGRENWINIMREENPPTEFISDHFKGEPNVLAHIRVQDFTTPEGKKVLLVDEIQSDWHQSGRKKGYKSGDEEEKIWDLTEQYNNLTYRRKNLIKEAEAMNNAGPAFLRAMDEIGDITPKLMKLQQQMDELREISNRGVPDAPFKKNWHELAMKRVLDYAAENGYDSVAITPGAEQAKRYDLSKQVDELLYNRNDDGTYRVLARTGGDDKIIEESIAAEKLEDYVGKEIAQKIIDGEGSAAQARRYNPSTMYMDQDVMQSLSGIDLQVGGEGMKGFYDKILPDYLNNYGKKYGASVEQSSLPIGMTEESKRLINDAYGRGTLADIDLANAQAQQQMHPVHSFNITPQMREEIRTKGQPMYGKVAMPALEGLAAGSGAATIGSQVFDENNEQQVQNPVHFTENPDAMLLELMQRN